MKMNISTIQHETNGKLTNWDQSSLTDSFPDYLFRCGFACGS